MKTGTGQAREGDALFTQAFDLLEGSGRERGAVAVAMRNERATALLQTGEPRRAVPLLEANLQVLEVDAPGSPRWLYGVRGVALAQWSQGLHTDALAGLERGLESTDKAREAGAQAETALDLERVMTCDRGFVLSRLGRLADAAQAFKNADLLRQRPGNFSRFYDTSCALSLAEHHLIAGRQALARKQLDEVLATLSPQAIGFTATALTLRAMALSQLGEGAIALEDGARALALTRPSQGDAPHSSRTGRCLMVIATAQQALGNTFAARAIAQVAVEQLQATVDPAHPWLQALRELIARS